MNKKVYKRNTRLILSIFFITITTIFTNLLTTIDINMIPENFFVLYYIFLPEHKVYILIILLLVNIVLGYIPLFHFFLVGGRKWILKQFIPIIFNSLFAGRVNKIINENNDQNHIKNNWYRITCYKYIDRYKSPISFLIEYLKRYILKNTSKYKERTLNYKNGYLICYYRYGIENGKIDTNSTSINYQVSKNKKFSNLDMVRGIAGRSFISDTDIYYSLNHKNINSSLDKMKNIALQSNQEQILKDENSINKTIEENIKRMKDTILTLNFLAAKSQLKTITNEEEEAIVNFMGNTNTDFNSMFSIGNGKHSNHFLGLKIKDKNGIWGVIVVDSYEQNPVDFWNIINPQTSNNISTTQSEEWVKCLLNAYVELLSNSVSKIIFEGE